MIAREWIWPPWMWVFPVTENWLGKCSELYNDVVRQVGQDYQVLIIDLAGNFQKVRETFTIISIIRMKGQQR